MKCKLKDKREYFFYLECSVLKLSLCYDCCPHENTNNVSVGQEHKLTLNNDNIHVDGVITSKIIVAFLFFFFQTIGAV